MAQPYRLPLRGASGAPTFDPEQPQTLLDYFEDLEYIFEEAAIYEDEKCKAHAVRYAPTTEKSLWRSFASFKTGAYEPFKQEVIKEYLGEGGKRLYSVGDLKVIVADALKTGFRSISDFKLYSRKFRVVADYLVEHSVLRVDERDRWFLKALPDRLQAPVLDRLRYKCPDVLAPRIPYTVEQVTEATEFILDAQDEDGPGISSVAPSGPSRASADTVTPQIKSETSHLADVLKTAMAQALALVQRQQSPTTSTNARQTPPHLSSLCIYCGGSNHAIRRCPQVDTDTTAHLVKCNELGQVVLASGSYVPSNTPGTHLRDRVQEYYRTHPDARPAATATQMLFEPVYHTSTPPPMQAVIQYMAAGSYPRILMPSTTHGLIHNLAHDKTSGAFVQLEQEIYTNECCKSAMKPVTPALTRAKRAQKRVARFDEPEETAVPIPRPSARIEEIPDIDAPQPRSKDTPVASERAHVTVSKPSASASTDDTDIPEHPFRNVRDATYAPPTQRNFGLPPAAANKPTAAPRKNDAAYKSLVPIYDPKHAANVFKRCLETPISLTHEELLALAPEIRHATREACSTRRVAVDEGGAGGEPRN
ncbi:hypothetical protein TRAPUB_2488, partial [Trametes pubescens]